jgi:hypothetical protein
MRGQATREEFERFFSSMAMESGEQLSELDKLALEMKAFRLRKAAADARHGP